MTELTELQVAQLVGAINTLSLICDEYPEEIINCMVGVIMDEETAGTIKYAMGLI